jgi:predicted DNA-binding transcriptional regulator YafY
MANKNQLVRYLIIDELLRNRQKRYPSKRELIHTIQERTEQEYSDSSLEKDLRAMREHFKAPIEFHNLRRGYFYGYKEHTNSDLMIYEEDERYKFMVISMSQKDLAAINLAESILEGFKDTGIFQEFSGAIDKVLDAVEISKQLGINEDSKIRKSVVQMDTPVYVKGREFLAEIVRAIREQKQVQFDYQKFDQIEENQRILHPYLLKEYKGRWYLVGYDEHKKRLSTFGLDRMSRLYLIDKQALSSEITGFQPQSYYQNCLGIYRDVEKQPEEIILSFSPFRANYIKTQPIHSTQKELLDIPTEYRISLQLLINQELIMEILSYGNEVKVIAPQHLAQNIAENLQKTLELYLKS